MRLFKYLLSLVTTIFGIGINDIEKSDLNITEDKDSLIKEMSQELVDVKRREFELLKKIEKLNRDAQENKRDIKSIKESMDITTASNSESSAPQNQSQTQNREEKQPQVEQHTTTIYDKEEELNKFTPKTFVLIKDCNVLTAPNGIIKNKWFSGKVFTSYSGSEDFIKISGEIRDKRWISVTDTLWIERDCVKERGN